MVRPWRLSLSLSSSSHPPSRLALPALEPVFTAGKGCKLSASHHDKNKQNQREKEDENEATIRPLCTVGNTLPNVGSINAPPQSHFFLSEPEWNLYIHSPHNATSHTSTHTHARAREHISWSIVLPFPGRPRDERARPRRGYPSSRAPRTRQRPPPRRACPPPPPPRGPELSAPPFGTTQQHNTKQERIETG